MRRIFSTPNKHDSPYHENSASKEKEGKVSVHDPGNKKKHINKDEGDYIDFEEVKK